MEKFLILAVVFLLHTAAYVNVGISKYKKSSVVLAVFSVLLSCTTLRVLFKDNAYVYYSYLFLLVVTVMGIDIMCISRNLKNKNKK